MSAAKATGSAWKLPPDRTSRCSANTQRIVAHRIGFDRSACRGGGGEKVAGGPHDLGLAAEANRDPARVVADRDARRGSRCRRGAGGRRQRARTWPGCGLQRWMRGSNGVSEPMMASVDIAPATSAACNSRSASISPASARAVETCVPFSSARPSFGPAPPAQADGGQGRGAAAAPAAGQRFALADQPPATDGRAARGRRRRRPSPGPG